MEDLRKKLREYKTATEALKAEQARLNGQGPVIVCRTVSIPETELLQALHIHNADKTGYRLYLRLRKRHPDLTPKDVARAVREIRLMAELWIDAVAARLDQLQPYGLRQPRYRRRHRRLHWPKITPRVAAE
jgi:hypothetical protein